MKKLYQNHNYTLCHPEAPAERSGHKTTVSLRFFTAFRMMVCLSSSCMTAVLLTCLLLTTPTQAKWGDNCTLNGGTIIRANQYGTQNGVNLDKGGKCNDPNNADLTNNCNGMEFCVSNKTMNWWSAFTWCDSIGGKLASFEHLCPGSPLYNESSCPNLKGGAINWIISSTGWGKSGMVDIKVSAGRVTVGTNRTRSDELAICEE